jgi:hypothetical protein
MDFDTTIFVVISLYLMSLFIEGEHLHRQSHLDIVFMHLFGPPHIQSPKQMFNVYVEIGKKKRH